MIYIYLFTYIYSYLNFHTKLWIGQGKENKNIDWIKLWNLNFKTCAVGVFSLYSSFANDPISMRYIFITCLNFLIHSWIGRPDQFLWSISKLLNLNVWWCMQFCDRLTVQGRRSTQYWKASGFSNDSISAYHKQEILQGPYQVVWPLPANVNKDSVSAEFL